MLGVEVVGAIVKGTSAVAYCWWYGGI